LFQIIRNAFRKKTVLYGDVACKTEQLVREKAESYGLHTTLAVVKIDENTLRAIKEAGGSDKAKVINLVNSIRRTVVDEEESNPYLKPIGGRAEAIMDAYDEQSETGFDATTFSIYWTLKQQRVSEAKKNAVIIKDIFERFPNHRENVAELRQLKAELYKMLLLLVGKDSMVSLVDKLLQAEAK
jgi:type I restriction enzyme R subunit